MLQRSVHIRVSCQRMCKRPRRHVVCAEQPGSKYVASAAQENDQPSPDESSSGREKVYIGQGKFIDDDPRKYPSRDATSGGWAGGEQGLQNFLEQLEKEGYSRQPLPRMETESGTRIIRPDKLDGKDLVYLGKGEFIRDDDRKYAAKEDSGFLRGTTGGFAGGERGVQMFTEKGNLSLAESEVVRKRQRTRDAILVVTLTVIGACAAYWLQEQGLVSFEPPSFNFEPPTFNVMPAGSFTIEPSAIGREYLDKIESTLGINRDDIAVLVALLGVLVAISAIRRGIESINNKMVTDAKRNLLRAAFLAATGFAAYQLWIDQ